MSGTAPAPAAAVAAPAGTAPTGPGLRGLVAAQLIGLRTRGTHVLLALSVLVPLAITVVLLVVGQQTFDLTGADLARPLTDTVGNQLFALLIGAFVAGPAYRHGTIVPTLLAAPRRLRVTASALLVAGGVTAAVAVLSALLGAAVTLPWLAAQGVPLGEVLADPRLWWRVLGQIAAATAGAVLGAALAVLLRGALGAVLLFIGIAFVEGAVSSLWPEWTAWGFLTALGTVGDPTVVEPPTPVWAAVLVVAGVVAAAVAAALVSTARRDAA